MSDKVIVGLSEEVGTITINRERQRNALDDESLGLMKSALEKFAGDDSCGAIVITGSGTKAFSAGSDIKELATQNQKQKIAHTDLGQAIGDMIEQHPCAVIAAMEGYCLGGGLELSLSCDIRICSEDATFGLPEVATLGALPSWGGTVRLPRIIGLGRAREMILFGRRLTAKEALEWGLVNQVAPTGSAFETARAFAQQFVAKADRQIVAIAKGLVTHGLTAPARTARHLEYLADLSVLASDAIKQGMGNFVAKRG